MTRSAIAGVVLLLCPVAALEQDAGDRPLTELWQGIHIFPDAPNGPSVVRAVAKAISVPLGLETLPNALEPPTGPRPRPELLDVTMLTLREVLVLAQRLDPRYEARVMDGVIVMRPAEAWRARHHLLDRRVGPLTLTNVDLGEALHELWETYQDLGPFRGVRHDMPQITVSIGTTTMLGALNSIARTAQVNWSIGFHDYDGHEMGFSLGLHPMDGLAGVARSMPMRLLSKESRP